MTYVEEICGRCGKQFTLEPGDHKDRLKKTKSGKLYCSQRCASIATFKPIKKEPIVTLATQASAEKWGVSYKAAQRIRATSKNPALQDLLAGQSRYQAQRLKDMREAAQR